MSGNAKLAQIQSLVAELEKPQTAPKTADHPGTDDHPVRSLQGKIEREFNRITDESPNSVAASISDRQNEGAHSDSVFFGTVDITQLDTLLSNAGMKSKRVRAEFARSVGMIASRIVTGENIETTLAELKRVAARAAASDFPPLPRKAPYLYADRPEHMRTRSGDDIISYLRDPNGWGPWTSRGLLSRPELGRYDPQALTSLKMWLHKNGGKLPAGLDIPTKSEVIDRMVASGAVPAPVAPKVWRTIARREQRAARR